MKETQQFLLRNIFIAAFNICCVQTIFSQPIAPGPPIDYSKAPPSVADAYLNTSTSFLRIDLKKSEAFADTALKVAEQSGSPETVVGAYRAKAIALAHQGEYLKAKQVFITGRRFCVEKRLRSQLVKMFNGLSNVNYYLSSFDSSIWYATKSLTMDSSIQNRKNVYAIMGTCYRYMGEYATALSFQLKALKLSRQIRDKSTEGKLLINIGNLYAAMGEYSEAIIYFDKALAQTDCAGSPHDCAALYINMSKANSELGGHDEANRYLLLSRAIIDRLKLTGLFAELLRLEGRASFQKKEYKKSQKYLLEAVRLADRSSQRQLVASLYLDLGQLFYTTDRFLDAKNTLYKSLGLAKQLRLVALQSDVYEVLRKLEQRLGNDGAALKMFAAQKMLDDSITGFKKMAKVIQLREIYNSDAREMEIAILKAKAIGDELKITKSRTQLYVVGFIVISFGGFYFVSYLQQRIKRDRKKQHDILIQQMLVVNAQEQVHEKISRDLHDNVGQKLVALKYNLESKFGNSASDFPFALLEEISHDLRSASHHLSPFILTKGGLVEAVRQLLITSFKYSDIKYHFEDFGRCKRYAYVTEINIYRICQELIANIIKHSSAKSVFVQVFEREGSLILVVEDDGVGMLKQHRRGFGLQSIENRVKSLTGTLHIDSAEGKGTTVTVRVPSHLYGNKNLYS